MANPAWLISGGGTALAVGLVLLAAGLLSFLDERDPGAATTVTIGAILVFGGFSLLRFGLFQTGHARVPKKKRGEGAQPPAPSSPPAGGGPGRRPGGGPNALPDTLPPLPPQGPHATRTRTDEVRVCPGCGFQELASRERCDICGTSLG